MLTPATEGLQVCEFPSDESLIESIAEQEHSAIASLFHRHRKALRSIILQVLHDEAEAEDVLQETILQIWREATTYSAAIGRPLGWIAVIARRRAIDRVRRLAAYSRAKDRFEAYVESEPRPWMQSCYLGANRSFRYPTFPRAGNKPATGSPTGRAQAGIFSWLEPPRDRNHNPGAAGNCEDAARAGSAQTYHEYARATQQGLGLGARGPQRELKGKRVLGGFRSGPWAGCTRSPP